MDETERTKPMRLTNADRYKIPDSKTLDGYIADIACGDMGSLEKLYRAVSPGVYAYALSVLKNTHNAEDVLQDCFLKIYRGAADYTPCGKPMAWIMTIAKNLCMSCITAQEKTQDLEESDWESIMDYSRLSDDDRMVLFACMNELREDERRIVVLHAVSGFKHREIAALLDLPLSTVLSKYSRAIAKLRAYYEREE